MSSVENVVTTFKYDCTSHSVCSPKEVKISAGYFLLEVWGASGGTGSSGGTWRTGGGYSRGVFVSNKTQSLFIYLGGSPPNGDLTGGYNGGGGEGDRTAGSGGGASDIRTLGGSWNSSTSLSSRIIVAGGSGGGHAPPYGRGGYGGGLVGLDGLQEGNLQNRWSTSKGCGGDQNKGGQAMYSSATSGALGEGGRGYDGGGGGGGYYGGGGGYRGVGGGGGSGYIGGVVSLFNYSAYSIMGNFSFPSPASSANETGHHGHGYARITYIKSINSQISKFRKHKITYVKWELNQFLICFISTFESYSGFHK